jgi:hypothetical protein
VPSFKEENNNIQNTVEVPSDFTKRQQYITLVKRRERESIVTKTGKMMMTKPKPEGNNPSNVESAAELKKKTASAAVSDLERRLAELGNPATAATANSTATVASMTSKPVQIPTPTASASVVSTNNKNALLVRYVFFSFHISPSFLDPCGFLMKSLNPTMALLY